MATVNKNFRIKNGLVVEGLTATVNGFDVLTKAEADELYIVNLIGGQATSENTANTIVKRDENGNFAAGVITANEISIGSIGRIYDDGDLIIQATEDGDDVVVNADDVRLNAQDDVWITSGVDGSVDGDVILHTNGGEIRLESNDVYVGFNTNNEDRVATHGYVDQAESDAVFTANSYTDSSINDLDTDDIEEGASNKYFTNQRALDATSAAYDVAGAASAAEAAANTYTDNAINGLNADDIEEGSVNLYFTQGRARGSLSAGTGISYDSDTGVISVDANSIATQSYVDTAVSNLVNGAPELLDTLNELAAAIGDDENFVATVTTQIGEKVAKAGDTMTGALVLHADPVNNLEAATKQYVDAAQAAAEQSAQVELETAIDNLQDGTSDFTVVDINSVSRQVAATTGNIATAAATTAYSWLKADYRSAKFMVKIKNGSHTEVCEILVTLDTSDNVYVTEYGMSSTSGTSLGTITADVSANDVRVRVTPANDNSEVIVAGTLLI